MKLLLISCKLFLAVQSVSISDLACYQFKDGVERPKTQYVKVAEDS